MRPRRQTEGADLVSETQLETPVPLEPGTRVEVRSRFDRSWARGFEVATVVKDGYGIRRRSDGALLPATFDPADVRPERRHRGLWWA